MGSDLNQLSSPAQLFVDDSEQARPVRRLASDSLPLKRELWVEHGAWDFWEDTLQLEIGKSWIDLFATHFLAWVPEGIPIPCLLEGMPFHGNHQPATVTASFD